MEFKKEMENDVNAPIPISENNELTSTDSNVSQNDVKFRLYKERWIVAFVVCCLQFANGMMWISFAPIANLTAGYYETSLSDVNWITTQGFIVNVIISFPAAWILNRYNLKYIIYIAGITNCLSGIIRFFGTSEIVPLEYRFTITFIGTVFSGIAYPFLTCTPTAVSQLWFPTKQRLLITTICAMSSSAGSALGSILSPYLVPTTAHLYVMNWLYCAINIVTGLFAVAIRSSHPPTPPSISADIKIKIGKQRFLKEMKNILTNKNLMMLIIMGGGVTVGVPSTFNTLTQQLICPYGYSDAYAGNVTFLCIVAALIGAPIFAIVAEKTGYYEEILKVAIGLGCGALTAFFILNRFPDIGIALGSTFIWLGITSLSAFPLVAELGVETAFPVTEGIITNFVILAGNIQAAIFIPLMGILVRPMNKKESRLQDCTVEDFSNAFDMTYSQIFLLCVNTAQCFALIFLCHPKLKRRYAEEFKSPKQIAPNPIPEIECQLEVDRSAIA